MLVTSARASLRRAGAAAWRASGDGSLAFMSIERPHRLAEAAVAQGERRLGAHRRALVGQRRQQQPRAPPVLELAHEVHAAGGGPRRLAPRGERALHLRQRGGAEPPQRLERGRLQGRIGESARAARAARGSPSSPSAATAARRTVSSSSAQAGEQRDRRLGARMRPSAVAAAAAHAPVLVLQGQRAAPAPPAGRRSRRGPPRRRGAGCGPASRSAAISGPHRRHRADRAQRLDRGEAQLLARVGEQRQQARHRVGLRIWPSARTVTKRIRGSGSASSGSRSAALSGSCSLPEREHGLLAHQAALVARARRAARRALGRLQLAQRLDARPRARSRARRGTARPARARSPDPAAAPSVSAARTRTSASPLASACSSSGSTRSPGMRARAPHRALLDQLALVAEQLEQQHGASSSPSCPIAAAASARTSAEGSWMSGATRSCPRRARSRPGSASSPAARRRPGARGRGVGAAVLEADARPARGHVLLQRRPPSSSMSGALAAASLSQPSVIAAVRRLRGSSSASIASR